MTKLIIASTENINITPGNVRQQPIVTWLHFLNFITIAILCVFFLKIFNKVLLFYEWLFPFKRVSECPVILVLGPKNDIVQEIIFQLSKTFKSKIIFCQDLNDNFPKKFRSKKKGSKSQIICSHEPISSREVISKLRTRIIRTFGFVDILVVLQNNEPARNDSTHSFMNYLNKQLLIQFWTVMAFLPGMLRRNKGHIFSVALGKASLINTGIMRTVHEELLQCNTNVKLTLVESNTFLDKHYLPSLSSDVLASFIVRSMWNSSSLVKVPSLPCYLIILPMLILGVQCFLLDETLLNAVSPEDISFSKIISQLPNDHSDCKKMNQSGSYSVSKKGQGHGDNQYYLLHDSSKNGPTVTPKSITRTGSDANNFIERQPFLDRHSLEPVRLTPAWEGNNLSDDELNFKNVTMEQANLEVNPPKDRYNIVYLIMVLHGVGVLMPWNMFITARSYFVDYKMSKDYTGVDSNYAIYFLSYVGFASQIPNLLFNWINIFIRIGGNLTTRIVWTIFIEVVMFVCTIILAMTDTSQWPGIFFWLTMVIVIILNMANGIYQNTVYGVGAKLPFKYSGAVILGSNISGTFVSVIDLLSVMIAPSTRTAAIYYFITALFVLLACFDTYFALPLNRFYRYHEYLSEKSDQKIRRENAGIRPRVPYWQIFKKASPQLFNVFFVFFVTLSIFPAMQAGIKKSDPDFIVPDKYYENVLCFLTFNTTAMLGSLASNWIRWPSPKYLIAPVVLRALFIPFFLFCNYQPSQEVRKLPVLIANDWGYWSAGILLGFTSGYFSSVGMMYTSGSVESTYASTAGMFGGAIIITGVFLGVLFSMVFPWIVENVTI